MSRSRSRAGQLFSTDLVGSLIVFFAIINLSMLIWQTAYTNETRFTAEKAVQEQVIRTTDFLVRTQGYPANWTAETVEIAGLADPHHALDNQKLSEFAALPYTRKKEAMRLSSSEFHLIVTVNNTTATVAQHSRRQVGDQPVALLTSADDRSGFNIWRTLNGTGITWDLYQDADTDPRSLTARNTYNYSGTAALFDDMVANASNGAYSTVIAEAPNVETADLSNTDELEEFVKAGGTYLHTGSAEDVLDTTFGFTKASDTSDSAVVKRVDPLLNSSYSVGDAIEFDNFNDAFTDGDRYYVNDTSDPHGCFACEWAVENGTVYYAADTLTDGGMFATFTDGEKALRGNVTLEFGRPYDAAADTVIPGTRSVIVNTTNGMRQGTLRLVLWR